ncbi:MAG: glycoside hydrolase family 15 protein [Bdellovibrionota bacterium]
MKVRLKMVSLFFLCFFVTSVQGAEKISFHSSLMYLQNNIHPVGTEKGIVVASPSQQNPDYFFHWVRDSALVMNTLLDVYLSDGHQISETSLLSAMYDYVDRVKFSQYQSGFEHLGEPKYYVSGYPFNGPWGRPQNDGPALRAITLIKFANFLLDKGERWYVLENLYKPVLPALSPIKMDLEFVAQNWQQQGFDYWEEVKGLHFSTAMVQRKALLKGAELALKLDDAYAARYYLEKVKDIEELLKKFWNPQKGYIESTIEQTSGVWKSQLDISVILGVLHGATNDGLYSINDLKVMETARRIEDVFANIFPINQAETGNEAPAIGRYPEDSYDGYSVNGEGNPWFIATFAMAEYYFALEKYASAASVDSKNYRLYCALVSLEKCQVYTNDKPAFIRKIKEGLRAKAEGFLARADFHSDSEGHMSEQMNRYHGFMQGARDLTWSYAAHVSALLQKGSKD